MLKASEEEWLAAAKAVQRLMVAVAALSVDEVAALAAASEGRITVRHVYRTPTDADRATGRFDAEGVVDRALLQSLLRCHCKNHKGGAQQWQCAL